MSNNQPIISKDADRLIFIAGSVTVFFTAVSWTLYGIMKLMNEESDWRPVGHSTATAIANHPIFTHILCRRRTLYEAGDDSGSEDEDAGGESSEPENEGGGSEVYGWGGTGTKID
jgi:hypothetical protein